MLSPRTNLSVPTRNLASLAQAVRPALRIRSSNGIGTLVRAIHGFVATFVENRRTDFKKNRLYRVGEMQRRHEPDSMAVEFAQMNRRAIDYSRCKPGIARREPRNR